MGSQRLEIRESIGEEGKNPGEENWKTRRMQMKMMWKVGLLVAVLGFIQIIHLGAPMNVSAGYIGGNLAFADADDFIIGLVRPPKPPVGETTGAIAAFDAFVTAHPASDATRVFYSEDFNFVGGTYNEDGVLISGGNMSIPDRSLPDLPYMLRVELPTGFFESDYHPLVGDRIYIFGSANVFTIPHAGIRLGGEAAKYFDVVFGDDAKSLILVSKVPEPSTMLLLGFGLVGLAGARIRKHFKK
jgi:hypothetical protein